MEAAEQSEFEESQNKSEVDKNSDESTKDVVAVEKDT